MAKKPAYEELEQRIKELEKEAGNCRQALEELRESKEKYHVVFETAKDGIFVCDETGRFTDVNQSACESLGYSKEELLQLSNKEIDANETGHEAFVKVRNGILERATFEVNQRRKDGTLLPVEITGNFFDWNTERMAVVIARNITERKQAEKKIKESEMKFRTIADFTYDWEFWYAPTGEFTYVSPSCKQVSGHEASEFMQDAGLFCRIIHPADRSIWDDHRHLSAQGKQVPGIEYRVVRPDGSERWVEHVCQRIFDEDGKFLGTRGSNRDITERKQAEKMLQEAHDELELRVEKRTAELVTANEELKREIIEHTRAEETLKEREEELETKTISLEEINTALRVLLNRRDKDKTELEGKVLSNVKEMVIPFVEKVKNSPLDPKQLVYINIIESNLNDIISPFLRSLTSKYLDLTPTEIHVSNLIKVGKSSKEMAGLMNLSIRTIEFHRDNIRKKLGLKNQKTNLRTYLLSLR